MHPQNQLCLPSCDMFTTKGEHVLSLSKRHLEDTPAAACGRCPQPLFWHPLCGGRGPGRWLFLSRDFFLGSGQTRVASAPPRGVREQRGAPFMCGQSAAGTDVGGVREHFLCQVPGVLRDLCIRSTTLLAFIFFFLCKKRPGRSPHAWLLSEDSWGAPAPKAGVGCLCQHPCQALPVV